MKASNDQAKALKALHVPGNPLFLANVHNAEVARTVASMPNCKAIATASFSIALANETEDAKLSLETQLEAVKPIAAVAHEFNKPLTVDLQSAYGDRLEEAITAMIDSGVVGVNIEDSDQSTSEMMDLDTAVERVKAALAAANKAGIPDFVVNARSDSFFKRGDLDAAITRGKAYLAAGATSVYILGHSAREVTHQEVDRIVKGLDGRVNIAMKVPQPGKPAPANTRQDLVDAGVARVSIGPQLFFTPADEMETAVAYVTGV